MKDDDKKVAWTVWTSKRLKKHIEDKARREGRSKNNMLEYDLCKLYGFDVYKEI